MWSLELVLLLPLLTGILFWVVQEIRVDLTKWGGVFEEMKQFREVFVCDPIGSTTRFQYPSHDAVLDEMLKRWHAKTIVMMVPGTDRRRVIDAWDGKVAHQIYFGEKTYNADVRGQLEKDKVLIQNHMVRHVIWHFFASMKSASFGPNDELRNELVRSGVGWMIYPLPNQATPGPCISP